MESIWNVATFEINDPVARLNSSDVYTFIGIYLLCLISELISSRRFKSYYALQGNIQQINSKSMTFNHDF